MKLLIDKLKNKINILFTIGSLLLFLGFSFLFNTRSIFEILIIIFLITFVIFINLLTYPKFNKLPTLIIFFLLTLYVGAQKIYFREFGQYFRLKYAFNMVGEMTGYMDSVYELIKIKYIIVPIFFVVFYLTCELLQKNKSQVRIKFRKQLIIISLLIMICIPFIFNKILNSTKSDDDFAINLSKYSTFQTISNTNTFVEDFGLYTLVYRDASLIFKQDALLKDKVDLIDETLNYTNSHTDNEYTGIFKDKNILFVMGESFMDIAVNEVLTPTLYKMKTEGIFVEGFNTPLLYGSTSDTEFMTNLSIIPDSSEGSCNHLYPVNSYKATLPNIYKDEGYQTVFLHNTYFSNYSRDVVYPCWGYEYLINDGFLDPSSKDCSDSSFMQKVVDSDVINGNKQMVFWITYSGHQPYIYDATLGIYEENIKLIEDTYPNLDDKDKIYLAKNIDLNNAIESFIESLKEKGELDNWVIVLFGDHSAKTIDMTKEGPLRSNVNSHLSSANTDLIIYNSAIEPIYISKISTALDIMPTIANLFGIEIDYSTIYGRDIFDENYNGFYFSESGIWQTNDYIYNPEDDSFTFKEDSKISLEEAKEEINKYMNIKKASKYILETDFFAN